MDGIVLFNGKVGYRFFPKVACTSIKRELYRLKTGIEYDPKNHNSKFVHDYMYNHTRSMDNCEFRFMVFRDPIERFLSAYSNRVVHYGELSKSFIQKKHPELISEIEVFDPTLPQFIENLDTYLKVRTIKHHTAPMVSFMNKEGLEVFNHIYSIKELSMLERDLSDYLKKSVKFGRSQTGGPKLKLSDLDCTHIEFLHNFYMEDYALLNEYIKR